jgi:hypothetical protein
MRKILALRPDQRVIANGVERGCQIRIEPSGIRRTGFPSPVAQNPIEIPERLRRELVGHCLALARPVLSLFLLR